jgi:outer membrane protein assembly factor BamA
VEGNERTRERVVLRFVPFENGDVIDVDDPRIELTRYRLLGTGFFKDVQFSLRKGSRRGHVILVINVAERNTVVVNDLWMGLSADADTHGEARPLTTYAGLDVAETNLAGTGMTLGAALGIALDQFALRVRHLDPGFLGTQWMVSTSLLYNDANDFFGNARVRSTSQGADSDSAVVQYRRFGGSLGVGRDLSVATQLWAHYRLESIDAAPPVAAVHTRGGQQEPIIFDIVPGKSVLSSVRGTLQYDSRDHPFLPTRGWFSVVTGEFAVAPLGSDYEYQRIDVSASRWWPLPWARHVLRLELFAGAITGDAPFFEQYYVGDLSDFLPARILGLNFDRRPSPNFLGTAIEEVRYGLYAAKVGAEYRIPLYRGTRSIYGIDLFASGGIFALAHRRDIASPPRSYTGAATIPVDLTANFGFRMDTSVGGVGFSFANALRFVPVRGKW